MRSYGVLLKWIFERLSSFITNCHKVVYNKKKLKPPKSFPISYPMSRFEHFCKLPPNFLGVFFSQGFGEEKIREIIEPSLFVYFLLSTMSSPLPSCFKHVGRQPGECRGAAVRHHNSKSKSSPWPHTEVSQQSVPAFPPSTPSIPDCARLGGNSSGVQAAIPTSQAFISKFCKSGACHSHWKESLCVWALFRPHTLNNCKWGWVGATIAPSLVKPEFSTHSIHLF